MAGKRRKVHDGPKEEGQEQKLPDLISNLPDHVIHHILFFLRTVDVVRMSLLSRRWRQIWYSVPALEFRWYEIKGVLLNNFVEQCLEQRRIAMQRDTNSVITRFELCMDYHRDSSQIDRWLSIAAQPHLQELEVNMMSESPCYCLPQVVLSLTSLTVLNLDGVKLQDCTRVNLPSLKSLSLRDVLVKDEVLHNLVLRCPAIQNLVIMVVNALSYIEISSSSLKHLDIDADLDEIQVDAINLESFVCFGTCNYYIASCKKLSSLSLTAAYFPLHEDLENIISGFPLLESLTLTGGSIVDVRHPNLKVLVLERSDKEDKNNISIDAPNLVSFTYSEEDTLPQILVNSPNLLETNITLKLYLEGRTMKWYVNMLNFLSSFDCSKSMSLNLHSEESVIFPETLRKITHYCPLPNLRHLKVKTRCVQRESDLENSLRWLAPFLETLSIEQSVE